MTKQAFRKFHRKLAWIIFVPFLLSAITGILYEIGDDWLNLPRNFSQLLMSIHTGRYLGEKLTPFYVGLNGLGVIAMIVTGLSMTSLFRNRRNSGRSSTERNSAQDTTED